MERQTKGAPCWWHLESPAGLCKATQCLARGQQGQWVSELPIDPAADRWQELGLEPRCPDTETHTLGNEPGQGSAGNTSKSRADVV